jgi:hypothetical protein
MPSTYTPIATVTASGSTGTVTFSSIVSTYTDLILIIEGSTTGSDSNFLVTVNNDSGSNYSFSQISGNGSSAASFRVANTTSFDGGYYSSTRANTIMHFMNYSNTTTNKTMLWRFGRTNLEVLARVGLWRSTSAINRIDIISSQNYSNTTTFTLYGIKAA